MKVAVLSPNNGFRSALQDTLVRWLRDARVEVYNFVGEPSTYDIDPIEVDIAFGCNTVLDDRTTKTWKNITARKRIYYSTNVLRIRDRGLQWWEKFEADLFCGWQTYNKELFPTWQWLPLPKDILAIQQVPMPDEITFFHSTLNRHDKQWVVSKKVAKDLNFPIEYVRAVTHDECIEKMKNAAVIFDNFGRGACGEVTLEAMAIGRPVICFVYQDMIENLWNIPVFSPAQGQDPVEYIKALSFDRAALGQAATASRQWAEQNYTQEKITNIYLQLFTNLLNS